MHICLDCNSLDYDTGSVLSPFQAAREDLAIVNALDIGGMRFRRRKDFVLMEEWGTLVTVYDDGLGNVAYVPFELLWVREKK